MTQQQIIWTFGILVGLLVLGFVAVWFSLQRGGAGDETQTEEPGYFDFLGFGGGAEEIISPETEAGQGEVVETGGDSNLPPRLRKLTDVPVSAAISTTTSTGLVIRYMERGTGNVYDVDPSSLIKTRQSQTVIPRIQEAFWLPGADRIVSRFFDSENEFAETFSGTLIKSNRESDDQPPFLIDGEFLETDIETIGPSASDKKIAYILKSPAGSALFTAKSDGTGKTQIYSSPIKEWLVQWFTGDTIALTSKPSSTAPGFLYFISIKGGQPERILPGTFGLTTLVAPLGDRVLFGEASESGYLLNNYIRKEKTVITIPTATIPDKCVWSKLKPASVYCGVPQAMPGKDYPDIWYMGVASFEDDIWEIDTTSGVSTLIAIPQEYTTEELDIVNLSLSKNEEYLVFTNKKDGALWVLDLEQ